MRTSQPVTTRRAFFTGLSMQMTKLGSDFFIFGRIIFCLSGPHRPRYARSRLHGEGTGSALDGSFRDLLWNTTTSPAMTNYLDNIRSSGEKSDNVKWARQNKRQAGLNDNLARELLELHTVTPAYGYTEDEIRSVAKILAGWGMDAWRGQGCETDDPARFCPPTPATHGGKREN